MFLFIALVSYTHSFLSISLLLPLIYPLLSLSIALLQQEEDLRKMTIEQLQATGTDETAVMLRLGLPIAFTSTKGKCVPDGNVCYANVTTKRRIRQFMNRKEGLRKPLPTEAVAAQKGPNL